MSIVIDWVYLLAGAAGAVGIIEYAKGFAPLAPSWTWRAIAPMIAVGVAIAGDGGVFQIATNAILILALSQIAYQSLIQFMKGKTG